MKIPELLKAPIEAMRGGRFLAMRFEPHPVIWIPACLAMLLALPLFLMVIAAILPIFGLLQLVGFWGFSRTASRGRAAEAGIEIYSRRKVLEARLVPWSEIESAAKIFDPPVVFLELTLVSGEKVPIHFLDWPELVSELELRQIPYESLPS